jgi:hypothetical protein
VARAAAQNTFACARFLRASLRDPRAGLGSRFHFGTSPTVGTAIAGAGRAIAKPAVAPFSAAQQKNPKSPSEAKGRPRIAPLILRRPGAPRDAAIALGISAGDFAFAAGHRKASEIVLFVHWVGGVHSEIRLPKRRRGQRNSTSTDVIAAVRQLVLIAKDDLIAGILNRNGFATGIGNRWTRERVTALRSHHRIPVYKAADDGIEPWLNLSDAAKLLHVSPKTLRLATEAGVIEAVHPLPDGPWIFSRAALSTLTARAITEQARQNPKRPAGSHPDQQNLFS